MIVKKYEIDNIKNTCEFKLCIFSDIHFSDIFKLNKFNKIKEKILIEKPDYICIPGDIIDSNTVLKSSDNCEKILNFFKEIGKLSKVIVSLGNHDLLEVENKNIQKASMDFWKKEFKKLKNNNVFLLDNEIYEDDNIRFIGFNLSYEYYYKPGIPSEVLIKEFNQNIPNFNNDKLNILLCHSPIHITDDSVIKKIKLFKNIDIIISGHMHNGMVPLFLDKIFPKNRGIISPSRKLFPDNARGIKEVEINDKKIFLIISGGITKIHKLSAKILLLGNYIYHSQMEHLIIIPKINK